jgi:hypothetical protein
MSAHLRRHAPACYIAMRERLWDTTATLEGAGES